MAQFLDLLAGEFTPLLDTSRHRDHVWSEPLKVSRRYAMKNDVAFAFDIEVASRERIFFLRRIFVSLHFHIPVTAATSASCLALTRGPRVF
jgi:hypothetical protein